MGRDAHASGLRLNEEGNRAILNRAPHKRAATFAVLSARRDGLRPGRREGCLLVTTQGVAGRLTGVSHRRSIGDKP